MEGKLLKLAFLFAGQGSQKVGMGKDLYDNNETFRNIIDSLKVDFDIKKLMFEGPMEQLSQTRYTQPCMAAFAAGVIGVLNEKGIDISTSIYTVDGAIEAIKDYLRGNKNGI